MEFPVSILRANLDGMTCAYYWILHAVFTTSHRMQGSLEIFVKSLNAGNGQMLSSFSKQHYNASVRTEATQTKF